VREPPAPGPSPLDDEHAPLFTIGQVASLLHVQQAFLRRIDDQQIVSPERSSGGQRRYSRHEIGRIQQITTMTGQGMTLPAIARIIELQHQLAAITRERDQLAARLAAHNLHHHEEAAEGGPYGAVERESRLRNDLES
jgi:MerR family transcriptional regulator/heat shock protein HspR